MKNPHPTPIPLPSGNLRNLLSQSDPSLTFSRASLMPLEVILNPVIVLLWGGSKLAKRKSIGSTCICSAISSRPTSTAQRVLTAPWPRIAPDAGLFVQTRAPV